MGRTNNTALLPIMDGCKAEIDRAIGLGDVGRVAQEIACEAFEKGRAAGLSPEMQERLCDRGDPFRRDW